MATRGPSVRARQNDEDLRILLRAAAIAHARAQHLESVRIWVSVCVALTAFVAMAAPRTAPAVAILGGAWAVAQGLGLSAWSQYATNRAAIVQEMFDVALFHLDWNRVLAGDPLSAAEISQLARSYRDDEVLLTDYYEIPELPQPLDGLACQQQNLAWGVRVRQRYATAVAAVLIAWCALGIAVGAVLRLEVGDVLLGWYLPALGALMMSVELVRLQRKIVAMRLRVLGIVRERTVEAVRDSRKYAGLDELMRRVQDVLLISRQTQVRVPEFFFLRFRRMDKVDFERAMAELQSAIVEVRP